MEEHSKRFQAFSKTISEYKGQNILISLRGAPDPDSISSALAHQALLEHFEVNSTILHMEEISHQENRALVKLLHIDVKLYKEGFNVNDYSAISLVDSQRVDMKLTKILKDIPILSIIDHHTKPSTNNEIQTSFTDVRQEVGATATIYAEYLKEINLLDKNIEDHVNLATALVHGIRTDTNNLISAKETDFNSLAYLSKFADSALLEKISRQSLTPGTMEIIFSAFRNKEIIDDFLISGVGMIRPEERDALPQSADFLLRRTGIHTVMVFGIVGEYIDCSLRTNSDLIKPQDFIAEVFSDIKDGECGGKFNQGGFRLPLGIFRSIESPEDKELLVQLVERYIKKQLYAKL